MYLCIIGLGTESRCESKQNELEETESDYSSEESEKENITEKKERSRKRKVKTLVSHCQTLNIYPRYAIKGSGELPLPFSFYSPQI